MRRWLSILGVFLAASSSAGSTEAPASAPVIADGFHELVAIVGNAEAWANVWVEVGGWEVIHRGEAGAAEATFWGLEPDQQLREVVVRNRGAERGGMRLIELPGIDAPMMRPHAQSWDTGGHFDFNVRVADIEVSLRALERQGFGATSEPVEFSFGPFRVSEVLARGPDGVVIAMIQRLAPPLEGWPHLRRLSRIFNATQVVADFDRALHFYRDVLGFEIYLEHEGASAEAGPNVLGLPHNLATEIPRRVTILSPDGDNDGSVEILSFEGASGADFSQRSVAPHRGIAALRFPVDDLDRSIATLKARGVEIEAGPTELHWPPMGRVRAVALRSPEGARLELFQELP